MKRIAKTRQTRLVRAVASFVSTVRRTVAGRTEGLAQNQLSRAGVVQGARSIRPSTVASRVSLVPAHAGHFDWLASLIRDGAAEGSFDAELATDTLASRLFFANLRRALETGYFLTDRGDGPPGQTPASGYVYVLSNGTDPAIPIGFALMKSIGGLGFELWLVAIDPRFRGRGFCRAMLQSLLATPAGMLARVNHAGRDCEAIGKALEAAGYRRERDGPDVRSFVRQDAPTALVRLVRDGGPRLAEGEPLPVSR